METEASRVDTRFSGRWETADGKILGMGTGYVEGSFITVEVFTELSEFPFGQEFLGYIFPALYLRGSQVGGTLFDVRVKGIQYGLNMGITKLTLIGSEFISGLHVPNRNDSFSNKWIIVSPFFPVNNQHKLDLIEEKSHEIAKYDLAEVTISIHTNPRTKLSQTTRSITHNISLQFEFLENISIETFLSKYAQVAQALLDVSWRQKMSLSKISVGFEKQNHDLFAPYLNEYPAIVKTKNTSTLISAEHLNYGAWFLFSDDHREIIFLLADLLTGGTGFLQSQLLNTFILLNETLKLEPILGTNAYLESDAWKIAREKIVNLASELGFESEVSRKLAKGYRPLIGEVADFLVKLTNELGIESPGMQKSIKLLEAARNDVAHSLRSDIEISKLISLRMGGMALGALGVIKLIWGIDVAKSSAHGLEFELSELHKMDSPSPVHK